MIERVYGELQVLHDEVERDAAALATHHAARLQCRRGCSACCVDGITVFEVEAERILRSHPQLLEHGRPHVPGACAFLDENGACRIYSERPYVCRTQGLPIRWLDDHEGEPVEYRDICPLNDVEPGIETLTEQECWSVGPVESRLAGLQRRWAGGSMRRVPLRSLFRD
jgi:Fe-S-cluster containining protein